MKDPIRLPALLVSVLLAAFVGVAPALAGEREPAEDAADEAARETGEALEEAARETGEAVDKAIEGAKKGVERAADALEKAGDEVEEDVDQDL